MSGLIGMTANVLNSADPVDHGPHQVAARVGTAAQQGASFRRKSITVSATGLVLAVGIGVFLALLRRRSLRDGLKGAHMGPHWKRRSGDGKFEPRAVAEEERSFDPSDVEAGLCWPFYVGACPRAAAGGQGRLREGCSRLVQVNGRGLEAVTWVNGDGIRYQNPEITLLFKAARPRPKDEVDLANAWPLLGRDQQKWLVEVIRRLYPGHAWLARLSNA